jgi:predicted DNA-binding protein YlxM (UPF0122 family)
MIYSVEVPMFTKDLGIGLLLDFYGDVLSEHTRAMMEMYYNEDLSLAEIAESAGISRQGVRQAIKKGEETLTGLEEKLGLCRQAMELEPVAKRLLALADAENSPLASAAKECAALILTKQGG